MSCWPRACACCSAVRPRASRIDGSAPASSSCPTTSTYRAELKVVLKRIDDSLAPHRSLAEETARAYLVKVGLADTGDRGESPKNDEDDDDDDEDDDAEPALAKKASQPARDAGKVRKVEESSARVSCPKCGESNEPDAKFCKECATKLSVASKELVSTSSETDSEDADDA